MEIYRLIMRRIILLFLAMLSLSINQAYASSLPDTEASLGGVRLGMSMSDVEKIYGEPLSRKPEIGFTGSRLMVYPYGDSFHLYVWEGTPGRYASYINEIVSDKPNGLGTPMGIAVGIPRSSVEKIYGVGHPWSNEEYDAIYTTQHGMHIDINYKIVNGEEIVSLIHLRFEG